MFGDALKEITDRLGVRFLLYMFVPTLLFAVALFLVYASGDGIETTIVLWEACNPKTFLWQLGGLLLSVLLAAKMLEGRLLWMTRQLEGEWQWIPWIGPRLRSWRQRHFQQVVRKLDASGSYRAIYRGYPLPTQANQVMATRLGNVLKNAELYADQRYELDAVLLWPRFSLVLPDKAARVLAEARTALDLGVLVTFLGAAFALLAGVWSLGLGQSWRAVVLWCVAGGVAAWLGYAAAVHAASTYGELVKAVYDLHRGKLCEDLGYKLPALLEEERLLWRNLCQLIFRSDAEDEAVLDVARLRWQNSAKKEKAETQKEG